MTVMISRKDVMVKKKSNFSKLQWKYLSCFKLMRKLKAYHISITGALLIFHLVAPSPAIVEQHLIAFFLFYFLQIYLKCQVKLNRND